MKLSSLFSASAAIIVVIADYLIVVSDCVIAGRVLGETALGAINLLMPVFSFIAFVAWLFSFGVAEAYARHLCRENAVEAARTARRGLCLAVLTALVLVGLGHVLQTPYLTFMGPTEEVVCYSDAFWTWYHRVIPLQCVYMLAFYLVFKQGHERTCLASYGIQMCVNAVVSYALAERYGMVGISLGTFIAIAVSLLVLLPRLAFLARGLDWKVDFDWRAIFRPLKMSFPHVAGWLFQSILFLAITKIVLVVWDSDSLPACAVVFCIIRLTGFLGGLGIAFRAREHKSDRAYRIASAAAFVFMAVVATIFFVAPELIASTFGIVSSDLMMDARIAARLTVAGLVTTGVVAYLPLYFRLKTSKFPRAYVNYLQDYILERIEFMSATQMFNLAKFFRVRQGVDLQKLADALEASAKSHAALWSTFEQNAEGEIVQCEKIPRDSFRFPIYRNVDEKELLANKAELVKTFKPFGGRLFDAAIYDCGERAYLLSNFHHLVCDGYSFPVILEDAHKVFQGETLETDAYYAILQKRAEKSMSAFAEAARTVLRESIKEKDFVCLPRPDRADEPGYGTQEFRLSLPENFEDFLSARRVTRHHVFLAATVMALKWITEADDVLVDWVFHGRLGKDELKTVGAFMVDLPLVVENASEMTVPDLVGHVKRATFNGIKNVNIIRDVTDCNPEEEERLTFIYQDEWGELMSPGPVRADGPYAWMIEETIPLTPPAAATENPFNVEIMEHRDATKLFIEYDTGRYSPELVVRYADLFTKALAEICV